MLIGAGALIFGVAIAKSGVLSKWVGVDKKMLDHFKIIIISSDNNNVTPNVVVDYEPTQRLGADIINEIKGNERFSDVTLNFLYDIFGKCHCLSYRDKNRLKVRIDSIWHVLNLFEDYI